MTSPPTSRSCSTGSSPCWRPRSTAPAPCWSTPPSASAATARRCSPGCELARVIGIDRDPAAPSSSRASGCAPYGDRFTGVHAVYDEIAGGARRPRAGARSTAVLFDLGVSSMQLDVRERGFAYAEDAPLDMRMDGTAGLTAADVLNTYPPADLTRVLREYGEERFARKIAGAVVRERSREPFTTLGPAGRAAVRRDPGAGAAYRRPPGQAHLPGAADGGQRRAGRAAPGAAGRHRRDRRRRPGGRGVLPLAGGPAGQAGVRRRDPQRRPGRPAVRAGGHEPALRLVTRGAEKADADEIDAEPAGRLGAAARRRTSRADDRGAAQHEHARLTAAPVPASRGRRGGRGRAGPADGRPAAAHPAPRAVPFVAAGHPGRCSAASSGCCSSTPRCSRRRSRRPRWSSRPTTLAARAADACRWSSTGCATRSAIAGARAGAGHGAGRAPGVPAARDGKVARQPGAARARTALRLQAPPPAKPADPRPAGQRSSTVPARARPRRLARDTAAPSARGRPRGR